MAPTRAPHRVPLWYRSSYRSPGPTPTAWAAGVGKGGIGYQEAQNATTVTPQFAVVGRFSRAMSWIRRRKASGATDSTTMSELPLKAAPPVTRLPVGQRASRILRSVESEGDWTLTICRSNRLFGVMQTAYAVTRQAPVNPLL